MVYKTLKARLEESVDTSAIDYSPLQKKIQDAVDILSNRSTRWTKREIQYNRKQREIFREVQEGLSQGYISKDEANAAYQSLNSLNRELSEYSYLKNRVAEKEKVHRRMQFNEARTERIRSSIDDYVVDEANARQQEPISVQVSRKPSFWKRAAGYGLKAACYIILSSAILTSLTCKSKKDYKDEPSASNKEPVKSQYYVGKSEKEAFSKSEGPTRAMEERVDQMIAELEHRKPSYDKPTDDDGNVSSKRTFTALKEAVKRGYTVRKLEEKASSKSADPNQAMNERVDRMIANQETKKPPYNKPVEDANNVVPAIEVVRKPVVEDVNEPNECDICDNIGFERQQYLKDKIWDYPNRLDEERKSLDAEGNHLGAGLTRAGWGLAVLNDVGEFYIVRPVAGIAGGVVGEAQKATCNAVGLVEGVAGGICATIEGILFQNGNNFDNGYKEAQGVTSKMVRGVYGIGGGIVGTAEGLVTQNGNNFDKGYKEADKSMNDLLSFILNKDNNFEKGWVFGDQLGAYVMDGVYGGNSKNAFDSYLLQLKLKETLAVPYCMEDTTLGGHFKLGEIITVDALPWISINWHSGDGGDGANAWGGGRKEGPLGVGVSGGGRSSGGLGR